MHQTIDMIFGMKSRKMIVDVVDVDFHYSTMKNYFDVNFQNYQRRVVVDDMDLFDLIVLNDENVVVHL